MKTTEHKETGEKMHVYEVSFLVAPSVSEDKLPEEASSIRSVIESVGGSIIAEEFPKLISLAYQMEKVTETKRRKFDEGYFGWFKFEMPAAKISDIKNDLDRRTNIIRHLIIKTVRENTVYSARLNEAEKKAADAENSSSSEDTPKTDDESVSKKEMDKSIDALVIS